MKQYSIGIDGNEANVYKKVGVSVYTQNLINYFQKKSNKTLNFNIYLRNKPIKTMPSENKYFNYKVVKGLFLWSQLFLPLKLIFNNKSDVFFSPAHYIPRFSTIPTVVTIHDLSFHYYPDDFLKHDLYKLKNWTNYSVKKSKKIIAVSESTKNDIIKFYGVSENKITVIYNGYERKSDKSKIDQKLITRVQKNPYILYVGTLQPRKNIPTLLDSFSEFIKENSKFKLVITGKKGWLYENIFNKVKNLKLEKNVIFADFVSDATLQQLYKNAFCLVLPSFYEGFGIPILEAMNEGCPV
ncbi:MAG: glycosyltransferase family 1 protein, partial [bacterium]|nr:glycosyltransferase family 1 protein [bacterium]